MILLPGLPSKPFLSKGEFGGDINFTDIGVNFLKPGWLNKVWSCRHLSPTGLYPNGFYQTLQTMNFNLVLDQLLFVHCQLEGRMATKMTSRLCTLCAGMCTTLKSNIVMTHDQSNRKKRKKNYTSSKNAPHIN